MISIAIAAAVVLPACDWDDATNCVTIEYSNGQVTHNDHTLPACVEEDSDNCFWDDTAHNDRGHSFVSLDGAWYYFDDDRTEPVVEEAPVDYVPDAYIPNKAIPMPLPVTNASNAWATWDAMNNAGLLPVTPGTVSYVSDYNGHALTEGEVIVWDSTGTYLFNNN